MISQNAANWVMLFVVIGPAPAIGITLAAFGNAALYQPSQADRGANQ